MTELNLITQLPTALSCLLLSDWLDLASVGRLDSALCNHVLRFELMEIFHSNGCVNNDRWDYNKSETSCVWAWIEKRDFKVWHCCVTAELLGKVSTYANKHDKITLMLVQGISASSEHFFNEIAAKYCKLKRFICLSPCGNSVLRAVLLANQGLEEVQLNYVKNVNCDQWASGIYLPQLWCAKFHISCNRCATSGVKMAANLTKLHLDTVFDEHQVSHIADQCHTLRSLHFEGNGEALVNITGICLRLEYLDLTNGIDIHDTHILSVVQNVHNLRGINLQKCNNVTEIGLQHIAKHCANTLEVLYIGYSGSIEGQHFSETVVDAVRRECTKLHTFHWSAGISYDTPVHIRCSSATLLHVVDPDDHKLQLIALYCRRVEVLDLSTYSFTTGPIYTIQQLASLLRSLATLKVVVLKRQHWCKMYVQQLWALFPHLLITADLSRCTFNVMDL